MSFHMRILLYNIITISQRKNMKFCNKKSVQFKFAQIFLFEKYIILLKNYVCT